MIDSFKEKYAFLSNFYWLPNGTTVEHLFQADKCLRMEDRDWIMSQSSPGKAKKAASKYGLDERRITIVVNWEEIKVDMMFKHLRMKFQYPELRKFLLETGDEQLIEGNWWHDNQWGNCTCGRPEWSVVGKNLLGKLLMQVREEIKEKQIVIQPAEVRINAVAGESVLYGPTHRQRGVK